MPKTKIMAVVPDIFEVEKAKELAKSMFLSMKVVRYELIAQYTGKPKHVIRRWAEEGYWNNLRHEQKQQRKNAIDAEIGDANKCKIRALKAIDQLQTTLAERTEEVCKPGAQTKTLRAVAELWDKTTLIQDRLQKQLGLSN